MFIIRIRHVIILATDETDYEGKPYGTRDFAHCVRDRKEKKMYKKIIIIIRIQVHSHRFSATHSAAAVAAADAVPSAFECVEPRAASERE